MGDRPNCMDPEDEFLPITITIDDLIDKLRRIRARHGNLEVFAEGSDRGEILTYNGVLVETNAYPVYAMLNNKEK